MTSEELLEKIQTDLEALAPQHLADFEVYVLDQWGQLPDERIILNLMPVPEVPRGIGGGGATGGRFEEHIVVEMRAEFPLSEDGTSTSRSKAFSVFEQLKAYVRANRNLTAGGDTSRYATYAAGEPPMGFFEEGQGEKAGRTMHFVKVIGTWYVVGA